MKENIEPQMIAIGKKVARYSAISGTFILLTFLISNRLEIAFFGLAFVFLAAITNGIIVFILVIELIYNIDYRQRIAAVILYMLLNIPLTIVYFLIVRSITF